MNLQERSDKRSKAYHKLIAKKLSNDPKLWNVPKNNLVRWKKMRGRLPYAYLEWEHILNTHTKEKILSILVSDSEDSVRLRSSSPFVGILNEKERSRIFNKMS
jgi:hypothetical protein